MPEALLEKMCRVVSDGTPQGTIVYGPDGVPLANVRKLEIELDCDKLFAEIKLTLFAKLDIQAKVVETILDQTEIDQ